MKPSTPSNEQLQHSFAPSQNVLPAPIPLSRGQWLKPDLSRNPLPTTSSWNISHCLFVSAIFSPPLGSHVLIGSNFSSK